MDLARNLIGRINVGDSTSTGKIQRNVRSEHAGHYRDEEG